MFDLDKTDIGILYCLYSENMKTKLNSMSIKGIMEQYESDKKESLVYSTLTRRIQSLVKNGYLEEGYKFKRAKSFFISSKGLEFMKENVLGEEICEEVLEEYENVEE